jgi:CRP/FNR family transcriptional regulator, cyclic AMP receptor protein
VLALHSYSPVTPAVPGRIPDPYKTIPEAAHYTPSDHAQLAAGWIAEFRPALADPVTAEAPSPAPAAAASPNPQEVDPLYLFACFLQWEREEEPTAAWELLDAAQSAHSDTRAHARSLLAKSRQFGGTGLTRALGCAEATRLIPEVDMNVPYGIEIPDSCVGCDRARSGFFCGLSDEARNALNLSSHKSVLPAGAILFVEGQTPRGIFIICSGKVNLSTTSREGKVITLKTAEAGEAVGLSAAISNVGYETTAETATPSQLNFVERKEVLQLFESQKEISVKVAHCLSRHFQSAYRDIHQLVLNRSSSGKLARLLLSQSYRDERSEEVRVQASMTHEEMAQRIGASRETVTRLIINLRRKKLIRADRAGIVIRDRSALEALAV